MRLTHLFQNHMVFQEKKILKILKQLLLCLDQRIMECLKGTQQKKLEKDLEKLCKRRLLWK